jgi:hypothetical protein
METENQKTSEAKALADRIRNLMLTNLTTARDMLDSLENTNPVLFSLVKEELFYVHGKTRRSTRRGGTAQTGVYENCE